MKSTLLLTLLMGFSWNAFAQRFCDQKDVTRAQELFNSAKSRVENGTMAPIDLIEAEYNLFEARSCATDLYNADDFCQKKFSLLMKLLNARQARFEAGMATVAEVIDAHEKIRKTKSYNGCAER